MYEPRPSRSLALQHVKLGDALEICDDIKFDFYPGLPHICFLPNSLNMLNSHYLFYLTEQPRECGHQGCHQGCRCLDVGMSERLQKVSGLSTKPNISHVRCSATSNSKEAKPMSRKPWNRSLYCANFSAVSSSLSP